MTRSWCWEGPPIELRSRVSLNQVVPFALAVLVLFGLALGPNLTCSPLRPPASSGWRCFSPGCSASSAAMPSRSGGAAKDGLRLSGLDPAGVLPRKGRSARDAAVRVRGRAGARCVGSLWRRRCTNVLVLVVTCLVATLGLAAVGTFYGALALGARVRETLLPLFFFPVLAPVLMGAMKAWQAGLAGTPGKAGLARAALCLRARLRRDRHRRVWPAAGGWMITTVVPESPTPRGDQAARRRNERSASSARSRLVGIVATVWLGLWSRHRTSSWATSCACSTSTRRWPGSRSSPTGSRSSPASPTSGRARDRSFSTGSPALRPRSASSSPASPRHRFDLGTAHVGHLVDLGSAAHDDGTVVRALSRLSGHPATSRDPRGTGQAERDRGADRVHRRADRVLLGLSGGKACTRRRRSSTSIDDKTTMHGSMAWTLLLGFCSFTLAFIWLVGIATASPASRPKKSRSVSRCARRATPGGWQMNGYVLGGYLTVLLLARDLRASPRRAARASRRRLGATLPGLAERAAEDTSSST